MTREEIHDLAEKAAAAIGEHVESVVIICTFAVPAENSKDGPSTAIFKTGRGNLYAQQGSAREWIEGSENVFNPRRRPPPPEPPDESEAWKQ